MERSEYSALARRLDTGKAEGWEVHDRALEMRRAGENVIMLSIGDPDFRTPEPIVDNAVSHMRVGRTHYSPALGELNLRRAVADYESRVSPHECTVDEVAIFPGATNAIHAVMSCLLDPGDEIVILDPLYVGYAPIMHALDASVRLVPTSPVHGFVPQVDEIMAAVTDRTRVVFINTPGNPTGAMIGRAALETLARFCQDRGIWLVSDEVYSMFTFARDHVSLRTAAESLDHLVVVDGLSKSHAMSGWRIGWALGQPELVQHLGRYAAMSVFGVPQFIQDASAFALNNDERYVVEMREIYRARRDAVCDRLAAMPGFGFHRPDAGMFVIVDISAFDDDDTSFASRLLDKEKVSLLPGSAFGESTKGHVRFSLTQPMNVLMQGCDRLERFARAQLDDSIRKDSVNTV